IAVPDLVALGTDSAPVRARPEFYLRRLARQPGETDRAEGQWNGVSPFMV
ncbi:uncharacterized protein METZ01_LOCUS260711, partial [marine metagenome]